MARPQEFSFRVADYGETFRTIIEFDYNGQEDCEGVWDDLENIIEDNLSTSLSRLGESEYESLHDNSEHIEFIVKILNNLGFLEDE